MSSTPTEQKNAPEELKFEQILEQLKQLVSKLEQGNLPLEQALKHFEEGIRLSAQGTKLLSEVESRLEVLTQEESGELKKKAISPEEIFGT